LIPAALISEYPSFSELVLNFPPLLHLIKREISTLIHLNMGIDYRDGVSILQLIVFPPCTVLAFLLCFRHGFGKASGWYFMITFSVSTTTLPNSDKGT